MPKRIAIGLDDFLQVREGNYFYIDKTDFIREWWESGDRVTLITRPRRFGKTLMMSTVDRFFSNEYENQGRWFEGLSVWEHEKFRALQGTVPVIFLSFASIKERTYETAVKKINELMFRLYNRCRFLLEGDVLNNDEKNEYRKVLRDMEEDRLTGAINILSEYLNRYYGKRVIIILDEYDTPMQEAYVHGYWDEVSQLFRSLFNSTFKTNPYMERALMTGITRVSKESIFSDLNNLEVITATSSKYETAFGFTQEEVSDALKLFGRADLEEDVKNWYDGFVFGSARNIYNPWSITKFLESGKFDTYWANTSSNALAGKLIRQGSPDVKVWMEELLEGGSISTELDEELAYNQLDYSECAIWSLLLASGYLKIDSVPDKRYGYEYKLSITNLEVRYMFQSMIRGWFRNQDSRYNDFIKAFLSGDLRAMNHYMNRVARSTFSYFDTGNRPSGDSEPERFYHGFVLGLIVELSGRYHIRSNRESGFGRYDVMLEPVDQKDQAYVLEFKVYDPYDEKSLEDTVQSALLQIEEKDYDAELIARGINKNQIKHYGFAFEGKEVLIG